MPGREPSLSALFRPRSLVVLGASADPAKLGHRTFVNLAQHFPGRLYGVNARGGEAVGRALFRSVAELPEAPDLAVLSVPVDGALETLQACAAKGIKSAVLFTSGFAELGQEGRRLQERLLAIARGHGMRLLGPNCMGFIDIARGVIATFMGPATLAGVVPGRVAILSQSGAIGTLSLALARERGLGISLWVTTGNQCDADFAECLAYLAEDDGTDVIIAGLEGSGDGTALCHALGLAHERKKPVVMLKIGRSEVGAAAIVSHTGVLAGNDAVYDAVFRAHGVHRAADFSELMDVAEAAAAGLFPESARIGLVTVSGGVGVMMADEAVARGLEVAPMPKGAQRRLKKLVPLASPRNPLDATTILISDPPVLRRFVEEVLDEGRYGAVVVFLATLGLNLIHMERTLQALAGLRQAHPRPPIVFVMATTPETRLLTEEAGFKAFDEPVRAVAALAALSRMAAAWQRPVPRPASQVRARRLAALPRNEDEALSFLAGCGIPVVRRRVAATRVAAERAAAALGFPVALKILSPDIAHKSDIGGVALGAATRAKAGEAFQRIMRRVAREKPRARLEGVLVAPMVKGGIELILGARRDPVFGPVVMLGMGGVFAETLKDVSLRLAPLGAREAMAMIRELAGYPLLVGARGRVPLDLAALARAIAALSRAAAAYRDSIESIDINPFVLLPKGGMALDALVLPLRVLR